LSLADREEIAVGLAREESYREIGARIGRPAWTVSREVARNGPRERCRARRARALAEQRARRPARAKLAGRGELRALVRAKLARRWSPGQVSAWLRAQFAGRPEMPVPHETIGPSLYVPGRGALRRELAACLRTGRARRRPRRVTGERRGKIPGMVTISGRPAAAADRAVPGHGEGDPIIGPGHSAIGTLAERPARFVLLLHLPGGPGADAAAAAMTPAMGTVPAPLRRSLTGDQGTEMAGHARIAVATGPDICLCDPHSPWQRGSNENTSGLLRRYFPKGTNLAGHSRGQLDEAAAGLNGRPRTTPGWKTPAPALAEILDRGTAA
jgi:IS30 family transposase